MIQSFIEWNKYFLKWNFYALGWVKIQIPGQSLDIFVTQKWRKIQTRGEIMRVMFYTFCAGALVCIITNIEMKDGLAYGTVGQLVQSIEMIQKWALHDSSPRFITNWSTNSTKKLLGT